jgi:Putative transposase/Transposase zinc-binding domain
MLVELLRAQPEAARTPEQRRAVHAILSCRTAQRGGHLYRCAPCERFHFAYHSCHHRACPHCGTLPAADWLAERQRRLLPVPYFLQTYTVPAGLRPVFKSDPPFAYDRLFTTSAQALREVALRKLGGEPAALGVLHTWSRQLVFHPHVHYIVPGGFLSANRLRWIRLKDPHFLLPEHVLSRRVRNLFRARLQRERPDLFARVPAKVWRQEWVVNTQPVGTGEKALGYLAAYVQRTALSAQRIVKAEHGQTTFRYRHSDTGQWKLLTLDTGEFLRRFLQHVLPAGFHRVRYFGWWSPAAKARWARVLALLDWKTPPPPPPRPAWVMSCPACGQPMWRLAALPRLPYKPP